MQARFEQILANEEQRRRFRQFLIESRCAEAFLFLDSVDELRRRQQIIYQEFLTPGNGSLHELNVKHADILQHKLAFPREDETRFDEFYSSQKILLMTSCLLPFEQWLKVKFQSSTAADDPRRLRKASSLPSDLPSIASSPPPPPPSSRIVRAISPTSSPRAVSRTSSSNS